MTEITIPHYLGQMIVLGLAVLLDLALGEMPEKAHLTVCVGKMTAFLDRKAQRSWLRSRPGGLLAAIFVIGVFTLLSYLLIVVVRTFLGVIGYVLISALLLKMTFAVRSLEQHTIPIAKSLQSKDLPGARSLLGRISRRDCSSLDDNLVASGTVEAIAEGTVDGIIAPLFYFMIFGVLGAVVYRVINTLDAMIGYRTEAYREFGWASAKLDTGVNFIPARLTALLMTLLSPACGRAWRRAWTVMWRDKNNTESVNAGWPMAAMAGTLGVQLRKLSHYTLGESSEEISSTHILRALSVMKGTTALFIFLIAIPVLIIGRNSVRGIWL